MGKLPLGPVLNRIGWTPNPSEQANVGLLRSQLIGMLGAVGDTGSAAGTGASEFIRPLPGLRIAL